MHHHPTELGKSLLITGSGVPQHYEYHIHILFTTTCFGWLLQPSSGRLANLFLLWSYTTAWWRLYKSSETCCCNCNEYMIFMGWNSSVSIATLCGLDGRGINSQWGVRFSAPVQTSPRGRPSLLYSGYWVFPGGKEAGAWCWPPTSI
jgi:hypothetical protein